MSVLLSNPKATLASGAVAVTEIDGSPLNQVITTLKFSNGAVTDNGDGSATVLTGVGGGGDLSSDTVISVDGEVALFSGVGGKTLKRSSLSGILKSASGVLQAATPGTDYLAIDGNGSQLTGLTKTQVSLANVDNTSDVNKPISTATQTALNLKAPVDSPTFTGTVGGITAAMVGAPSGSGSSSGTNTGNQTSIVGITGTLTQFNTAVTDADLLGTTGVASDLSLARIAGSTYSTVQHWRNNMASAGIISGGVMSDAGGAAINVTGGSCAVRPSISHLSTLYFADFPANNGIAIPTNTVQYVGIEYNAGSPVVAIRSTDDFDYMTNFPVGVVTNEAGILHFHTSDRHDIADADSHIAERMEHTATFARDEVIGGLILGETGTRNVTMSAGAMWQKLTKLIIPAFNSSTGSTFDIYYRNGAGSFTKVAAQTQWPNTQWDNGTGALATLGNNKYGVLWFYVEADDGMLIMLYGRAEHGSIAAAEAEAPPATVPNRVTAGARILGKIVFMKSAATATSVSSVFTTVFSTTGASNHANLANLDYASAGHTGFAPATVGYTVATLPLGAIGDTAYVTDATTPTYLGALTGVVL